MTPKPRNFAQLLSVAGAVVSVAVAPIAAADPTGVPEAGSESATATIKDLRAQGLNVSINWVSGSPDVPLSACQVTAIDTAAAPSASVSVKCPEAGDRTAEPFVGNPGVCHEVDDVELVVERVAALDVGKAGLEACVRAPHPHPPGRRMRELRGYGTTAAQHWAVGIGLR